MQSDDLGTHNCSKKDFQMGEYDIWTLEQMKTENTFYLDNHTPNYRT